MSRKGFVFGCTIILLIVSIVITVVIVVASVTNQSKVKAENVTTNLVSTETVIPDDYSERLIQGVLDGDLVTVKDLLEMTNDFVNFKPNENE